jgi:Ser/Thr protein kinase RdoA (MazF antagonist)
MNTVPASVLNAFRISASARVKPTGSGHINQTFLVEDAKKYILQRINIKVFTRPEIIATNNRLAAEYLALHHPGYLFLTALRDQSGNDLVFAEDGFPWRLYPLIEDTVTVDFLTSPDEAFEAAVGFARLSKNLNGVDCRLFKPTLERFQDLGWRYEQLEEALAMATPEALSQAREQIAQARTFHFLVDEYQSLIASGKLKERITHNDTKINNILFDKITRKAVCVIDLDTLMPGYFIYDLGDMVRTCVSPVSEEEKDISRITFRKEMYDALVEGYLSEMRSVMSADEVKAIPFAGKMMTYIMALRFLADFLRGNTYYHITYPEQNLVRACNQLTFLRILCEKL